MIWTDAHEAVAYGNDKMDSWGEREWRAYFEMVQVGMLSPFKHNTQFEEFKETYFDGTEGKLEPHSHLGDFPKIRGGIPWGDPLPDEDEDDYPGLYDEYNQCDPLEAYLDSGTSSSDYVEDDSPSYDYTPVVDDTQQRLLNIQKQQLEAQKEISRNAIRSQIAQLEAQISYLAGTKGSKASSEVRMIMNQINALKRQLESIR